MSYVQVYKSFLEELQFYGFLAVADVQKIFANLSELVEVGPAGGVVSLQGVWSSLPPSPVECECGY